MLIGAFVTLGSVDTIQDGRRRSAERITTTTTRRPAMTTDASPTVTEASATTAKPTTPAKAQPRRRTAAAPPAALPLETAPRATECLSRGSRIVTPPALEWVTGYRVAGPSDETTFDLRSNRFHFHQDDARSPQTNLKPVNVGVVSRPARLCVVGGVIAGTQSRDLGWEQLKHCDSAAPWDRPCSQDGTALLMGGRDWYLADGVRIDNTMDAVGGGTPGDRAFYRNIFARYIRDDCIGNDKLRHVVVVDSLFDGCYVGVSQAPSTAIARDGSGTVTLDRVLLRLQRMPGGFEVDATEQNHGRFFKWSEGAGRLVMKDSILVAEHSRHRETLDIPQGTVASNVTIVWLGDGPYPGSVVPGVTVTTDGAVWDRARTTWLARHGCESFSGCDTAKLLQPDAGGRVARRSAAALS